MRREEELEELEQRRELAVQMGGDEAIARHHSQGKLTVRERIDTLADPESFQEIGALVGSATYKGNKLDSFIPSSLIMGTCTLDGRRVVIEGGDFTIRGGTGEGGNKGTY